jgi:hypothetical protein
MSGHDSFSFQFVSAQAVGKTLARTSDMLCGGDIFFLELEARSGAPVRIGRMCSNWMRMILYSERDRVGERCSTGIFLGETCVKQRKRRLAGTNASVKAPQDCQSRGSGRKAYHGPNHA